MSENAPRRAKLLHRKMPVTWWLAKPNYFIFIMRELSSVFIALVAIGTILMVRAIDAGTYVEFLDILESPIAITFCVVALAFALLHTITFFTAAGKVLVIRLGEQRVPPSAIVAGHFGAWLVASAVIFWFVK